MHTSIYENENERTLAGSFAHEMRNSLSGTMMVMKSILPADKKSLCEMNAELLGDLFELIKDDIKPSHWDRTLALFEDLEQNEQKLYEALKVLSNATSRSMKLATLTLEHAKLGRTEPGQEPVYLKNLVEHLTATLNTDLDTRNITLELDLKAERPIIGNEFHFESIINNLIINARDAHQEITDNRQKRICINLHENGNTQILKVNDNATGMTEQTRQNLFVAFFSTKPATGTGLGLNYIHKLISMYGGTMNVESELGTGSTFSVTFPVTPV